MNEIWQLVFIITQFVLAGVLGWQVFLFKACQANKESVADLKLHIAENYARKTDIDNALTRLESKLDNLFDELHKRTARPRHE